MCGAVLKKSEVTGRCPVWHSFSGNATLFAVFVLLMLMLFGANYLISSRSAAAVISREANIVIARNLASAAFEAARLIIRDAYAAGNTPVNMSAPVDHALAAGEGESGRWQILYIKPLTDARLGYAPVGGWTDMTYTNAYGVNLGKYDIYEVKTRGLAAGSSDRAEMTGMVKIIRWNTAP